MNYCGSKQQRCLHTCPLLSLTARDSSLQQRCDSIQGRETEHASRVSQSTEQNLPFLCRSGSGGTSLNLLLEEEFQRQESEKDN